MASETSSNIQREASLRRIAIVLSSLPPAAAAKIMGTIDPESKRTVRRTMASLADVDPLERKRALHAFKVSVKRNPSGGRRVGVRSESGDEVAISSNSDQASNEVDGGVGASRVVSASSIASADENGLAHPALSFLADVNDETLVSVLSSEHPQAIAMVLASMNPSHAARVLPRLEAGLQAETLSRIGRLGNVSKETVGEVAQHLKQRVAGLHEGAASSANDPAGKRALNAILAQMPSSSRTAIQDTGSQYAGDTRSDGHLVSSDPAVDLTRKLRDAQLETRSQEDRAHEYSATEGSVQEDRPMARDETVQHPESASLGLVDADGNASNVDSALTDPSNDRESTGGTGSPHDHLRSTDSINAYLLGLGPAELCSGLGKVDTRTAMLALCGLPTETSNAVLAVLPKATARKVRVKMTSLGSLHLREIDEAKEVIAKALLGVSDSTAAHEPVPMAA